MQTTVLRLEDYGGAGDGVTDNGEALSQALAAAKEAEGPVMLELEKDATYYFENVPGDGYLFELKNLTDMTLRGDNTTISMNGAKLNGYVNADQCENLRIEGLNLKTSKSVYAIGDVLEANVEELYIDIQSDRDLEITETYQNYFPDAFGLPLTDYNRAHMFIRSIEVLDAGAYRYRIHLQDMDDVQRKMASMVRDGLRFLFPRPGWGESISKSSGAFIITSSSNVELENINMWSSGAFCYHMRYNRGRFFLRNVNVTPEPGTDMAMSGWRDGFHLKNNATQFTFENCTIERNFDDAFNTGFTALDVTKVYSDTEFEASCCEFGGTYYGRLDPGDTLLFYDEDKGSLVTSARIKEWVNQEDWAALPHIILEEPVPELTEGLTVSCLDVAQPGMVMRNCYINGSYRFRSPLKCEDTQFDTMVAWFDNLVKLEGPAASNQYFINCKFRKVSAPDPADSFGGRYLMEIGTVVKNEAENKKVLKAENIVFEDCELDPELILWKGGYDVTINGTRYTSDQQ